VTHIPSTRVIYSATLSISSVASPFLSCLYQRKLRFGGVLVVDKVYASYPKADPRTEPFSLLK